MSRMLGIAVAMALPLHAARVEWGSGTQLKEPPPVVQVTAKGVIENKGSADRKFVLRCESTTLNDVTNQRIVKKQNFQVGTNQEGETELIFMYQPSVPVNEIDWRCWVQVQWYDVKNCVVRANDDEKTKKGPVNTVKVVGDVDVLEYADAKCRVEVTIETTHPRLDYDDEGVALNPDPSAIPDDMWG